MNDSSISTWPHIGTPQQYKQLFPEELELVHVTVEVNESAAAGFE